MLKYKGRIITGTKVEKQGTPLDGKHVFRNAEAQRLFDDLRNEPDCSDYGICDSKIVYFHYANGDKCAYQRRNFIRLAEQGVTAHDERTKAFMMSKWFHDVKNQVDNSLNFSKEEFNDYVYPEPHRTRFFNDYLSDTIWKYGRKQDRCAEQDVQKIVSELENIFAQIKKEHPVSWWHREANY